jgi:hypothetical protein
MYRLDVLQTQWIVLALAGGSVLVLIVVLCYLALWRPRLDPAAPASGKRSVLQWLRSFLPAILIVTYVLVLVFVIAYTLAVVRHPPNW